MRNTCLPILLLLLLSQPVNAGREMPVRTKPFTIVRATLLDDHTWQVDRFSLLPEEGPPAEISGVASSGRVEYSLIDFALYRARYVSAFQGGLKAGLSEEIVERERMEKASGWGTYFFCQPVWPAHLAWRLALAGAEKEKSLDKAGMTIQIPSAPGSGIGEIPMSVVDNKIDFDSSILPENPDWSGVGIRFSYTFKGSLTPAGELYSGWDIGTEGDVICLLDVPKDHTMLIASSFQQKGYRFGKYVGRFELPLMKAIVLNHDERTLIGFRKLHMPASDPAGWHPLFIYTADEDPGQYESLYQQGIESGLDVITPRNTWPESGSLIRKWTMPVLMLSGVAMLLIAYHLVNIVFLKISYRGKPIDALIDPLVVQMIFLIVSTIFALFLGLGWIVAAYPAWRYLTWRHGPLSAKWFSLLVIPLLMTVAYEIVFADIIWV